VPQAGSRTAADSIPIHHFLGTSEKRRRQVKAERLGGSVSVATGTAALARKRVLGINPAIGISTARGRHALGVAGELAIAGIAPCAPLQTVAILYCLGRRRRYRCDCSKGGNSCQNGKGNRSTQGRDSMVAFELCAKTRRFNNRFCKTHVGIAA